MRFFPEAYEILLNRPARGNSVDAAAAAEIARKFREAAASPEARFVYLHGAGPNFCTGADLSWMSRARDLGEEENRRDALRLAEFYRSIAECDLPVLARVHGKVIGGGVGLTAASDIAACVSGAMFSLPETRIGLVPGTLTPHVVGKIGRSRFTELSLTGREFPAEEAREFGLVDFVGSETEVSAFLEERAGLILRGSRDAIASTKRSLREYLGYDPAHFDRFALLNAGLRTGDDFLSRIEKFRRRDR